MLQKIIIFVSRLRVQNMFWLVKYKINFYFNI